MKKERIVYKFLEILKNRVSYFFKRYKFHPLFIGSVLLLLFHIWVGAYSVVMRPTGEFRADFLRSTEDAVIGDYARLEIENRYEGTTTLTIRRVYVVKAENSIDELFRIVIKNFEEKGYVKKVEPLGYESISYEQAIKRGKIYMSNGIYLYEVSRVDNTRISISGKNISLIQIR